MNTAVWIKRIKCLALTSIFASVGNFISTSKSGSPVTPIEAIPGLLIMLVMTLGGCLIWEGINLVIGEKKNLPAIAYISLIAIILTVPGLLPCADYVIASVNKIGLLPLCTPILAYAGISIGKDMDTFKKQGVAIVLTAIFTFIGTFIGSVIIAHLVLMATGVI